MQHWTEGTAREKIARSAYRCTKFRRPLALPVTGKALQPALDGGRELVLSSPARLVCTNISIAYTRKAEYTYQICDIRNHSFVGTASSYPYPRRHCSGASVVPFFPSIATSISGQQTQKNTLNRTIFDIPNTQNRPQSGRSQDR
jgi:hypothetical protein